MDHVLHWQKSTFSDGGDGNTCVEIASTSTALHLRESDSPDTQLTTTPAPLTHLIHGIKSGHPFHPAA
ncbi:DUF397 domain-containing protein [Streptomyces sp. N50]|uniref:DUF397 domain-containing protein n=1 Tax=Streptomyces sp. N50 TaxID=3081765 RepID=UPI00296219C0|nr:DUF397 domain-containing protein [Streptomyces sp. N50]WOX10147.1 DUF397 domain-containing protein [Streptomyces sp. N50]